MNPKVRLTAAPVPWPQLAEGEEPARHSPLAYRSRLCADGWACAAALGHRVEAITWDPPPGSAGAPRGACNAHCRGRASLHSPADAVAGTFQARALGTGTHGAHLALRRVAGLVGVFARLNVRVWERAEAGGQMLNQAWCARSAMQFHHGAQPQMSDSACLRASQCHKGGAKRLAEGLSYCRGRRRHSAPLQQKQQAAAPACLLASRAVTICRGMGERLAWPIAPAACLPCPTTTVPLPAPGRQLGASCCPAASHRSLHVAAATKLATSSWKQAASGGHTVSNKGGKVCTGHHCSKSGCGGCAGGKQGQIRCTRQQGSTACMLACCSRAPCTMACWNLATAAIRGPLECLKPPLPPPLRLQLPPPDPLPPAPRPLLPLAPPRLPVALPLLLMLLSPLLLPHPLNPQQPLHIVLEAAQPQQLPHRCWPPPARQAAAGRRQ